MDVFIWHLQIITCILICYIMFHFMFLQLQLYEDGLHLKRNPHSKCSRTRYQSQTYSQDAQSGAVLNPVQLEPSDYLNNVTAREKLKLLLHRITDLVVST